MKGISEKEIKKTSFSFGISQCFSLFPISANFEFTVYSFLVFFLKGGCSTQQRKSFSSFMTRISKFEEITLNSDFREQFFHNRMQNNGLLVFFLIVSLLRSP